MTGYVRNDTTNNIADGNIVNASDFDGEFDAIVAAFVNTTGHTHDGTAAEGAPITKIGPTQDVVASAVDLTPKTTNTVDLGSSSLKFKDIYNSGTAYLTTLDLTNALTVADGGTNLTTFPALSLPVANTLDTLSALTATASQSIRVNSGGTAWEAYTPSSGTGDVVGPASAVSGNIATFDGTTGKLIQDGGKALPTGTIVGTTDTQTLTNKTIEAGTFTNGYTEEVFALGTSGSLALNPANGSIQTCALTGDPTFTDSLAAGQSIVLMLTNGASYTVTWPTITWVTSGGNVAPTLTAADALVFWKISTTLYGAVVGNYV